MMSVVQPFAHPPWPRGATALPCDCLASYRCSTRFVPAARVPPAVVELYTDPRLAAASVHRHQVEEDAAERALYWSVHLDGRHLLIG